jgi:hypothetical protein
MNIMKHVSAIMFTGWYNEDCYFEVRLDFVKKILVLLEVKLECYGYDYDKYTLKFFMSDDEGALTEFINKALDFASHVVNSAKEVKVLRGLRRIESYKDKR